MTENLEMLLRSNDAPFGGMLINSCEDTSLEKVIQSYQFIRNNFSVLDKEITIFDCWHEHDGFVTESKIISWSNLDKVFSSKELLRTFSLTDYEVRKSIVPKSNNWLFRWCLDPEDSAYNDFEACFSPSLLNKAEELVKELGEGVKSQNSTDYFNQSYGG